MKIRSLMAALAATALVGTVAWADETVPTTVTLANGQMIVLNRMYQPSVALYTHERGAYKSTQEPMEQLTTLFHSNLKEQSIILYRFE